MTMPSASRPLRHITAEALSGLVSLPEAIETQRRAFEGLENGNTFLAPRILSPNVHGTGFVYVARADQQSDLVIKVGSVVPNNASLGLPTVSSLVIAVDALTGRPHALLDGESVTNLRTVAASMLAIKTLASRQPRRAAVIGYGAQGRAHASAIRALWPESEVRVFAPELGSPAPADGVTVAASPQEAVAFADLVVTCTTASTPVLQADWLSRGCTVVSVGSFAPDRREVGDDLLGRAHVVVDHVATAAAQAGPVRQAVSTGTIDISDIHSLGSVLSGEWKPDGASDFVYYNSVGIGAQDAALVGLLLERSHDVRTSTSGPRA